jgi:rhomboid protease GluP
VNELPELPPPGLAEVGRYRSIRRANEHGLVVLSMQLPYWMYPVEEGGYALLVEAEHLSAAREQIDKFENESRLWPPRPLSEHDQPAGPAALLAAGVVLIAFFILQQKAPNATHAGLLDAAALFRGEWWRPFTALTLHADLTHLMANLGAGLFFGLFALRRFGPGLGLLLILLAGSAGNLLSATLRYPEFYQSLGASTAVFAALGLRVGAALLHARDEARLLRRRRRLVPIAAGIALLGLLGAGSPRVDVIAHATGFLSGLACGTALAAAAVRLHAARWQRIAGAATALLLAAAWAAAAAG